MHVTAGRYRPSSNPSLNRPPAAPAARIRILFIVLVAAGTLLLPPVVSAEDLTLESCIRAALAKNPNAGATALRVEAARATITQAKSAYYPLFMLSGDYRLSDNPTQAFMMQLNQRNLNVSDPGFNPNDPSSTDNLRVSLGL